MNREEIRKYLISPDSSLKVAMRTMNGVSGKVLFVTDDSGRLLGSVTDGDIRRAILNGIAFEHPVSEMMFKSPRSVRISDRDHEEKARRLVSDSRIYVIPVLDDKGSVVDILFWRDFFEVHPHETAPAEQLSNKVVIMAGGKGERLDPFTKILPKPLIPIGEKTIVEKIMDNFNKRGFFDFTLTLNYKKEIIKMYLKENQFPYNVDWLEEETYLGTAGSLGLFRGKIKQTFFVSNCDVILESDFKNILLWHKGEKAIATLIGCHKEMVVPYGTLEVSEGQLKSISEKPTFDMIINTGVYIFEPEVLDLIGKDERLDMDQLLGRIMAKGKVSVYPVCDGWFDIGQWKEYKDSLYMLQDDKK